MDVRKNILYNLYMRKDPLVTGMYYHVYNRGVDKRDIFINKTDLDRFILSIKMFNSIKPIGSIKDKLDLIKALPDVGRPEALVSIVVFTINPNHFHFVLKQEVDGGISEFLKRLLGGYTKYFNLVHNRSGSLFQGRFKSKLINKDEYFFRILPYAHMNHKIHNIPNNKINLVYSSEKEYLENSFTIVNKEQASEVLDIYGGLDNFQKECLNTINIIKEERGLVDLNEEDLMP